METVTTECDFIIILSHYISIRVFTVIVMSYLFCVMSAYYTVGYCSNGHCWWRKGKEGTNVLLFMGSYLPDMILMSKCY